jgi:hypothetical protein
MFKSNPMNRNKLQDQFSLNESGNTILNKD